MIVLITFCNVCCTFSMTLCSSLSQNTEYTKSFPNHLKEYRLKI